jgi:hypothetical protein
VQTFLPYSSFEDSAAVLDNKRLGKQRVETLQIMSALLTGRGWVNHPCTKMWAGYEWALLLYQQAIVWEWHVCRGFGDTCLDKTSTLYFKHRLDGDENLPPWLSNSAFHISHQSNLIRKDPHRYGFLWPNVPDNLPYIWPI